MKKGIRVGVLAAVFAAGYLCGSVSHRSAQAQMGDVMKKAAESGGPLGTAAKLGTAISDMQEEVNGLQKNLSTLRDIKTALGG